MVGPAPPDASSPARRLRVLLNPEAGAKGGLPTNAATEATVRTAMAHHGLGDELRVTVSEADAVAATREAADLGYDAVVAAGGDGTVGLVAGELLGRRTALGILPPLQRHLGDSPCERSRLRTE